MDGVKKSMNWGLVVTFGFTLLLNVALFAFGYGRLSTKVENNTANINRIDTELKDDIKEIKKDVGAINTNFNDLSLKFATFIGEWNASKKK